MIRIIDLAIYFKLNGKNLNFKVFEIRKLSVQPYDIGFFLSHIVQICVFPSKIFHKRALL